MELSFFDLRQRAFSPAPDPNFCAALPTMRDAFEELSRHLTGTQGISILSAPAGLGKTLLCRKLAETLEDTVDVVVLRSAQFATRRSLLQAILYELDEPFSRFSEQELRLGLHAAIRSGHKRGRDFVLLVDESHLLSARLLEEVRTLTNFAESPSDGIGILLSGQPQLEEQLAAPGLEALNQRILCHVGLDALTRMESADYIEYRIHQAGGEMESIFSPDAILAICIASDGNPRCLNQLSDHALTLAFEVGEIPVSDETVRTAIEELKRLPLQWNDLPPTREPLEQIREQPSETPSPMFETEDVIEPPSPVEVGDTDAFEVGADLPAPSAVDESAAEEESTVEFGFDDELESESTDDDLQLTSTMELEIDDVEAIDVLEDSESSIIEIGGDCLEPEPLQTAAITETEDTYAIAANVVELEVQLEDGPEDGPTESSEPAWEDVNLEADLKTTEVVLAPDIVVGITPSVPILVDHFSRPLAEVGTRSATEEEVVVDHYAALDVRRESLARVEIPAIYQTHSHTSDVRVEQPVAPLERYSMLLGIESSLSTDASNDEVSLRQLLANAAGNASRSVTIIDRVVLLLQEVTGLGVNAASESLENTVCHFDTQVVGSDEKSAAVADDFESVENPTAGIADVDDENPTIAFQTRSGRDATSEFDMPSQIVIDREVDDREDPEQITDAAITDTLRETREILEMIVAKRQTPRMHDAQDWPTSTSHFDAILQSTAFSHVGRAIETGVESYDIVMPETDAKAEETDNEPERFSNLFSNLAREA